MYPTLHFFCLLINPMMHQICDIYGTTWDTLHKQMRKFLKLLFSFIILHNFLFKDKQVPQIHQTDTDMYVHSKTGWGEQNKTLISLCLCIIIKLSLYTHVLTIHFLDICTFVGESFIKIADCIFLKPDILGQGFLQVFFLSLLYEVYSYMYCT